MKLREREIAYRLAAISLGFNQSIVDTFHRSHVVLHVSARKFRPLTLLICIARRWSRIACRSASFFTILQGTTPELIERGISRGQRIEMITLCKIQAAIVTETFQVRFKTKLCIVRRPL